MATVAPGLLWVVTLDPHRLREQIEPLFQENFARLGELGAAVSIWQNGESVLELQDGYRDAQRQRPWTKDTLVLVWSATKGVGSACLLHALQEHKIDLSRRVSEFWPEFGANGKAEISIATLMSHAAGLCALDRPADVLDYDTVIKALEKQSPVWPPGTAHGYHARTFGFLIDELTRRITGISIAEYWRKQLADPLGLEFWIGLPNELNDRVATMYAAKAGQTPRPVRFYRDLAAPGTLQRRVFDSPQGLHTISAMNKPEIRGQPIVSFGGIGTATSLARFYAILANNGVMDGQCFFSSASLTNMRTPLQQGTDQVFEIPTGFSAGFMMDPANTDHRIFGRSATGFGHPGAGGSHAFADPENGIGFVYVMNQMEQSVLPTSKAMRLVEALYAVAT